jgi:hypothetical protein
VIVAVPTSFPAVGFAASVPFARKFTVSVAIVDSLSVAVFLSLFFTNVIGFAYEVAVSVEIGITSPTL